MNTVKLLVFDYSTLSLHCFTVQDDVEINEDLISRLGLHPNNCEWMCGNISTIEHKGTIK